MESCSNPGGQTGATLGLVLSEISGFPEFRAAIYQE